MKQWISTNPQHSSQSQSKPTHRMRVSSDDDESMEKSTTCGVKPKESVAYPCGISVQNRSVSCEREWKYAVPCICGGDIILVPVHVSAGIPHGRCSSCRQVYAIEVRVCENPKEHVG
jgi:hypothetical protein